MRLLLILAAYAALTVSSLAQPPHEVIPADGIRVYVGQNRTFRFDQPLTSFKLSVDGIARAIPVSDREITILGLASGEVLATAYGENERTVHQMRIRVTSRPLVKIYNNKSAVGGGYASYDCTDTGCSRANPDTQPAPDKTTITETSSRPNGESVTFSREYR